jgi:3-hydroxyisobutyrate dehydrogenase-like beta-hydroxyacid dehydrogenase
MTTEKTPRRVSVLGLGLMGSALAEALLNAGHEVTVWNRTAGKADPLTGKGACAAGSAAEAIAAVEVTIICVSNHAATMEILGTVAAGDTADGKLLVQLSTMSTDDSRETAQWAESRGSTYLEGSIFGLPTDITGGSAMLVYSGPRQVFDANEILLRALGDANFLSDEVGAAVSFDKVYYAWVYGMFHAFIQGAAMAHAKGFSIGAYTGTILARRSAQSGQLKLFGDMIAARNHDDVQCRLDVHAAAFADTLAMCRETGVDDALPAAVMHNFERAIAAGHGDKEITAIFETLIEGAGP